MLTIVQELAVHEIGGGSLMKKTHIGPRLSLILLALACPILPAAATFAVDLEVGNNGESTASPYAVATDQDWDAVYVGFNDGSVGEIQQSSGMFRHFGNMYVGYLGGRRGTFTQTDGSNSGYDPTTGYRYAKFIGYVGGVGDYNLGGGAMSGSQIYVGYSGGTGTFNQTGGYCSTSGTNNAVYIGRNGGATGEYNLSDGTIYTQTFTVGMGGTGTAYVSGGTLSATNLYLGDTGTGTLYQSDGTVSPYNILTLGDGSANSQGTYRKSDGITTATTVYLGQDGKGTFTQSGGAFTVSGSGTAGGWLAIGNRAGSEGVLSIGGGTFEAKTVYVGYNGTAGFNVGGNGSASTTGSLSVNGLSRLAVNVGDGSSLTIGNTFTNDGVVRIQAGASAAAGQQYTPISAAAWTGGGVYQAVGGTWNPTTHVFTASSIASGTSGVMETIDLSVEQRLLVNDSGTGWSVGASFLPSASSSTLDCTATAISGTMLTDLEMLLDPRESVVGGWSFLVSGDYVPGDPAQLSFAVSPSYSDLKVWYHDGSGWAERVTDDLVHSGNYASFAVDGFSAYAVSAVPEPNSFSLTIVSVLVLIGCPRRTG
jgi:hypothetical protein